MKLNKIILALLILPLFFACDVDGKNNNNNNGNGNKTPEVPDNKASVTFDSDGGSKIDNIVIEKGTSLGILFPAKPVKQGRAFKGWWLDSTEFTSETIVNASITVKAKWETATYTIIFDANGGTGNMNNQVRTYDDFKGAAGVALTANTFTKAGYSFYRWTTAANGSGSSFPDGVKTNISDKEGFVFLYAQWVDTSGAATSESVSSYQGFLIGNNGAGTSTLVVHSKHEGKINVLQVTPPNTIVEGTNPSEMAYISYNLSPYAGKQVTITLSMNLWLMEPKGLAWQLNFNSYPVVAGSSTANQEFGKWVKIEGTYTGTVGTSYPVLYISTGHTSWGAGVNWPVTTMYIADLYLRIDDGTPGSSADVALTIGNSINLSDMANAFGIPSAGRTWSTSNGSVATVTQDGLVEAKGITNNASAQYLNGAGTGTATVTVSSGVNSYNFTIEATTAGQEDIISLPPIKDKVKAKFGTNFMFGNIAKSNDVPSNGSSISNQALIRHFDTLTSENAMKPDSYGSDPNNLSFANADRFVNAAQASGFKIIGHTLLWHQQNPSWVTNMGNANKETALAAMKKYITDVVGHYKGKIHTWDILNEVFPDGGYTSDWKTSMRQDNPWVKAIGSDFVYEGFLAARLADPNAILYYNDYNTDMSSKATMIRNMVKDVNDKYLSLAAGSKPAGDPAGRLLIEGIGMQEHHNLGVSAGNIEAAINLFKAIGVKISVSELDILAYSSYSGLTNAGGAGENKQNNARVTNTELISQATKYNEYMKLYFKHRNDIERVSLWGVRDDQSWRSAGLPLLFDPYGKAKPAYYSFIDALK